MADTKTTALTENTTPATTDIMYIVDDPGGSAASQKITIANLATLINGLSGRVLIAENSPSGSGTSTFSTIAGTYTSLEVELMARSTQAAVTYEDMRVECSGDTTGTNYRYSLDFGYGTTEDSNGGDGVAIPISAANAPANSCTIVNLKFPYYALTTFNKQFTGLVGHRRDAATVFELTANISAEWESTAAITQLDFILTAGNFVAGSKIRLYGVW